MPGFRHGSRRHRFRPTLAATLAVAVALPVLLGLGVWQLERGQEKARLLVQAAAVQAQPPLDLGRAGSVDLIDDHRPVTVQGVFLGERQGLLDNQVRDGQVGYDVLTPLRVEGLTEVLLVDRGWLARGARRSDVPAWQTPAGEVTLIGYLHRPADVPLVTGAVSDSFGGRWVVSQIDPALLGE
jgi:cytochrome oxidase assembly protein ShyY1